MKLNKKIKSLLLIPLLASPLILNSCENNDRSSCGGVCNNDPVLTTSPDSNNSTNDKDDEKENFEIKTTTYGLSVEGDGKYELSNATIETDNPNFEFKIVANVNFQEWSDVTMLSEPSISVQNKSIIPLEAIKVEIIDGIDIHGSSGSNVIEQIVLKFDRKLLNPGTTKIKLKTKALNGNSNNKESELCFEIKVFEYGSLEVETTEVNLNFKLEDSIKKYILNNEKYDNFEQLFIWIGYENQQDFPFGANCLVYERVVFNNVELIKDFSVSAIFANDVTYVVRASISYRNDLNQYKHDYLKLNLNSSDISSEFISSSPDFGFKDSNRLTLKKGINPINAECSLSFQE